MDETDYDALINDLSANERAILDEAKRHGTATVAMLRPVTTSPTTGKPLAYGLTRELRKLQSLGLLRRAGREHPARYAVVPLSQVDEAAKVYAISRKKKTRRRASTRTRLSELRRYEHGDYSEFYRVHRRVIELSDYISHHITRMAYWAAAPKDDLARTAQDLAELLEAVEEAVACLKHRADDDDLRATIAKIGETKGRTAAEIETARTLARRLQTQYDRRIAP
jgi:hypothetical protein